MTDQCARCKRYASGPYHSKADLPQHIELKPWRDTDILLCDECAAQANRKFPVPGKDYHKVKVDDLL